MNHILQKRRTRREIQSKNGVRVIVYRTEQGSWVDASCTCFGITGRAHSTRRCPLFLKLESRTLNPESL